MKKFKLLRLYPGCSVKIGTEVFRNGNYYQSYFATRDVDHFNQRLSVVENNPEFWEEVVIKEYEIVGFHKGDNTITSIKRLSDGVVFTVGDTVKALSCSYGSFIITHFIFNIDGEYICSKNRSCYLKNGIKLKQALFTTNDGVELFKGDSYCRVNNQSDYSLVTGFVAEGAQDNYKGLKFSTEIAAKKFIKENEKKYSLNDIRETIKKLDCFGSTLIDYLEKQ